MAKRLWKAWPDKFKQELNGIAGITSIGGAVTAAAGFAIFAGTVGVVTTVVGIVITGGTFLYAGIKAIPKKFDAPETMVGRKLKLLELSNVFPTPKRLSIIGIQSAGKTTLKNNLAFNLSANNHTLQLTAQIVTIPDAPPRYLAVIDGAGERHGQQFEAAKEANFLCIVIDHNSSSNNNQVSDERLQRTAEFLTQVRNSLIDLNAERKTWIEILINKTDLWESAPPDQKRKFDNFCNNELSKWQSSNLADTVSIYKHSNEKRQDINRFMDYLKSSL
jgi:hypothetical protein